MPLILDSIKIIFPHMMGYDLRAVLTFGALLTVRTAGTNVRITFVFSVPVSVRCAVFQDLIIRANIAIIIFIIYIFVFSEKFIFGLGSAVGAE